MSNFKLGRKAVKTDTRTLKLSRYFLEGLPAAPASVDWSKGITSFGEMLNDSLGDCTCAGVGHAVQVWTANASTEATVTDAEVEYIYEKWCGYDPANSAATDNGGVELDILTNWKAQGFAGHSLAGFADPNVGNPVEINQAIWLFGGLYIGLQVPNFIMGETIPEVWDVVADDGGIAGGHCVFVIGYDADYISFISWGSIYKMTQAFWAKYVDEAHALVSPDWIAANSESLSGFNLAQLQQDLASIN